MSAWLLRPAIRLSGFCFVLLTAGLDFLRLRLRGSPTRLERAAWLHRHSRRMLSALGIHVRISGSVRGNRLIVSNHLSYLDVLVLAARQPVVFVAKKEVRAWPVLGWFASLAGTLFIDRGRRSAVHSLAKDIETAVADGLPVVVFAEGTSGDGSEVLPFKASLLQPAVEGRWPVTPVGLDYILADGCAAREVCFHGDAAFVPHFLNLLRRTAPVAVIGYGSTRIATPERKALAGELRQAVRALRRTGIASAPPEEAELCGAGNVALQAPE